MKNNLITAGEFARLARTTKRTVLWYDQKEIIRPKLVDSYNNYRYYQPDQIIDYQVILLLKKLNFSLSEIKKYLKKNKSLKDLFKEKRQLLEQEILTLKLALDSTENYYKNLSKTGTLVNPTIKQIKSFSIYCLDREGPYSKIGDYIEELRQCFYKFPQTATLLTIFETRGYQPKKAKMKIGVIINRKLELKKKANINKIIIPGFKALSFIHQGSSKLLSLLWMEVSKYAASNNHKKNTTFPFDDLEIYLYVGMERSPDNNGYFAEIIYPIV